MIAVLSMTTRCLAGAVHSVDALSVVAVRHYAWRSRGPSRQSRSLADYPAGFMHSTIRSGARVTGRLELRAEGQTGQPQAVERGHSPSRPGARAAAPAIACAQPSQAFSSRCSPTDGSELCRRPPIKSGCRYHPTFRPARLALPCLLLRPFHPQVVLVGPWRASHACRTHHRCAPMATNWHARSSLIHHSAAASSTPPATIRDSSAAAIIQSMSARETTTGTCAMEFLLRHS